MPTVSERIARKARVCTSYPCRKEIEPGQRYRRHVAFPGDEGYEHGEGPWVIVQCDSCIRERDIYGESVRRQYGVPAHIDARITFMGRPGRVFDFAAGMQVWLDGERHPIPVHPTWEIEYLEVADGA
jgi:hypothetical protein